MFHVKHQKSGRFRGVPTLRGYSDGVLAIFTRTSYAASWRIRPRDTRPSFCRPLGTQRLTTESSGGSETIRAPPIFRNWAAHSAVTAGGPNDRAVTRSNSSTNSGSRAISSTRPTMTSPFDGAPSSSRASIRKFALLAMESVKTPRHCHCARRTRPGSPPPLPKSRKDSGGEEFRSFQHFEKPKAWAIWGSIAFGPKKPRALDSSRTRGSQSEFTVQLCRSNHHKATRVITF